MTEEQQIKLLEQYEEETKQKRLLNTSVTNKSKAPVGENVLYEKKPTGKKSKLDVKKKNKEKTPIDTKKATETELNKSNSLTSLETASSKSSTDDDWEKISDSDK